MTKQKPSNQFYLLSLGCSKNTVDSESMAQLLQEAGYRGVNNARDAQVLIVNTCGFIGPARTESIRALRELGQRKRRGQYLIAAGCLSQRYGQELTKQVPELDGIIGTRRWMDIVGLVTRLREQKHPQPIYHLPDVAVVGSDERGAARTAVQGHSAYLKIADGCRRPCAFCAIPLIKGTAVSRPPELIVREVQSLAARGVRELILIAQDSTDYGYDLGLKNGLAHLLRQICAAVPAMPWIRIMYAYPGYVTDELIDTMADLPQVLPYLDMPLQHADRETLLRMRRPANIAWVHRTVEKLRSRMPNLALRSTFIVGYPGETEQAFENLANFLQEIQFDRVGVFPFSFERGTSSEPLGDPIPAEEKEARRQHLLEIQQRISLAKNQQFVGQTLPVLVDGCGDGLSVCRSYRDAPEVDGMVIVEGELPVGEIVPVRVTGALPYDLSATVELQPALTIL